MLKPLPLALLALAVAALFSLAFGSVWIPLPQVLGILLGQGGQATFHTILLDIRLPRTILVLLTGMALAGSGATYQGLFRNPLADPYLIGVASGAGLGAVAAMSIRWPYTSVGLFIVPFAAFLAGLLTVFIVYRLAKVGGAVPTTNLILAGVAVSSFATALTSFLMLRSTGEVRRAISWLLGGFSLGGWEAVFALLPYVLIGLGVLLLSSYALNLLQFGDEQAQQLGLDVQRAKIILLAASSLVTAAAVAFSGIIGFVGLIIPHVARIWWGSDYRRLLPLSILLGGSALLFADLLARIVLAPQELPVGIVTALAGAPFFLWVLRRSRNMGGW
jgi:iron complex transport system permease protein